MGGSVKGGQILGDYPDNLTDDEPLTLSRGRMIPTKPWDTVFSGLAIWLGVPPESIGEVCPNIDNFEGSYLIDPDDMFYDLPSPTESPSNNPTLSSSPTFTPLCIDDTSFRYKGSRKCWWLGNKNRCEEFNKDSGKYIFEHCPKTCNKCICENKDWFWKVPNQDCKWVQEDTASRCDITGAKANCPEICGQPCCNNDADWFYKKKKWDCSWVQKYPGSRCQKTNAE